MFIVGYPLDYEKLCVMFNKNNDEIDDCVKNTGLELHYSDKGQVILGLSIPETAYVFHDFVSVDKLVILLLQYKKKFLDVFKKTEIDITKFMFYPMESEDVPATEEPCVFRL
jgi:hypothetical protein